MNISESIDRILSSSDLLGAAFYEEFFGRHRGVEQYFEGIHMPRQAAVLTMSLVVIERYYSFPYPATVQYLRYLGTQHSDRRIPPHLYPKWRDAMLATLSKFHGDDWDGQLEAEWSDAIDRATEVILEGYEERFHV